MTVVTSVTAIHMLCGTAFRVAGVAPGSNVAMIHVRRCPATVLMAATTYSAGLKMAVRFLVAGGALTL